MIKTIFELRLHGEGPYYIKAIIKRGLQETLIVENAPFAWTWTEEQRRVLHTIRTGTEPRDTLDRAIRDLGAALYTALFADQSLSNALSNERAATTGNTVRLVLIIESEDLSSLPWETLYQDGFLAVQGNLPIVRKMPSAEARSRAPILGTLHLLLVTASGGDTRLPNLDKMAERLQQALEERKTTQSGLLTRRIRVSVLAHASIRDLQIHLANHPDTYHALCFACHGSSEALFLEYGDETTTEDEPLTARQLVQILNTDRFSVRLIYLMACETAQVETSLFRQDSANSTPPLSGFARQLAQQSEISAVVAMQTKVSYATIEQFTIDFFRRINSYKPIDTAFAEARQHLFIEDKVARDFVAPVLYLQADDSRLFRSAVPQLLVVLVTVIVVAVLVIGVQAYFNNLQSEFQRRQETIIRQQEAEQRVQLAGYLSQQELLEVGTHPQQPVLINNRVWVSNDDILRGYPLVQSAETWEAAEGLAPGLPVYDGESIWVSSRNSRVVVRLQPDGTIRQHQAGRAPETPLVADDMIWVPSGVDPIITRIDPATGNSQSFYIGIGTSHVFTGENALWVVNEGRPEVLRLDTNGQSTLAIGEAVTNGTYGDGWLWLLSDRSTLLQVDPTTGHIENRIIYETPITSPIVEQGWVWAAAREGSTVFSVPTAQANTAPYAWELGAGRQPRRLFIRLNRLWVVTDNDSVVVFDLQNQRRLNTLTLPGSVSIYDIADDGRKAVWLISPAQSSVAIINAEAGTEIHRLPVCAGLSSPVFDGVWMWFSCANDSQMIRIPSEMIYVGPSSIETVNSSFAYTPLVVDDRLWIPQAGSGHLLIYKDQTRLADIDLGSPITALLSDTPHVWAATQNGRVFRLRPRFVQRDLVDQYFSLDHFEIEQVSQRVTGSVNALSLAGDYVWAQHLSLEHILESNTVSVFHRQSLRGPTQQFGVTSGFAWIDGDVWLTVADPTSGRIYRLTEAGEISGSFQIPGSTAVSWAPVLLDEDLWFVAGARPVNEIGQTIRMIYGCGNNNRVPGLYRFDRQDETFSAPYETLCAPGRAMPLAPYLWLTSNSTPVLTETLEDSSSGISGVFAVDVRDGSLHGPWQLCPEPAEPFIVGSKVWLGCNDETASMVLLEGTPPRVTQTYSAVGIRPWAPVVHEGVVWFTFRDSNTATAFRADTGAWLGTYDVGRMPGPPFVYDDQVWVYTLQSGVLQRLHTRN